MCKVSVYEEKSKKTGRTSLILITTDGHGNRTKRSLKLFFKTNGTTLSDKQDYKDKMTMAAHIAQEEEKRISSYGFLVPEQYNFSADFVVYAELFVAQHPISKRGKGKFVLALNRLKQYYGKSRINAYEITELELKKYARFLEGIYNGETAANLFSKLKQIINVATNDNYWRKNPAANIKVKSRAYQTKAVLNNDELKKLYHTPLGNDVLRRAFLFSSTCAGLRFCDIKTLRWSDVKDDHLRIVQNKTKTIVTIPLNKDAWVLLGERRNADSLVYPLPSHTACLKWLRKWTIDAGITKHITFHCSRHTYGTLLISNNVNLSVAAKLLGHHSPAVTERYVRVNEQLKQEAVEILPSITI